MGALLEMAKMEEETSLVDYTSKFHNSLNELRELRTQLYNAADYWKSCFLKSHDKKLTIERSKEYIKDAVLIAIDHVGCLSADLQSCLSTADSLPHTQHKILTLKQRIGRWQHCSYKLGLPCRFQSTAPFPKHYSRYISLPISLKDTMFMNGESSESCCVDAKGTNQLEHLHTLLPVEGSLSILPKAENSTFQFQEAQKPKRGLMNWKRTQKKEIASVVKRAKRVLT